ncbi:MAG TPA: hypothetical protein VLH94_03180 [Spirochaetia bacterium]|nr:hypothetical protein [Spirochaetia bacterium]
MDDQKQTPQQPLQGVAPSAPLPVTPDVPSQPVEDITPVDSPLSPEPQTSSPLPETPTVLTPVSSPTVEPNLTFSQPNNELSFTNTSSTPVPSDLPFSDDQQTPSTPSEPEVPIEKPKNKVLPVVGGIAALFLLLGVAGAAYYVSNQLSTRQAVAPTAPTSKPAAATPVPNSQLGDGSDGVCTVSTGSVVLDTGSCSGRSTADAVSFTSTANTLAGATSIILLSPPNGLAVGDEVLIINLQGNSSASTWEKVGQYEIHTIASITENNTLNFTDSPLTNSYDGTTQKIVVQRIPNYSNVTVASGATLTASAWDGTKGGVLAFKANGTVNVAGTVTMTGKGYRGGTGLNGKSQAGESFCGYNKGLGGSYGEASRDGSCGGGGGGGAVTSASPGCIGWPGGKGGSAGGAGGGGGGAWWEHNGGSAGGGGGGGYGTAGTGGQTSSPGSGPGADGGTNVSGAGAAGVATAACRNGYAWAGGGGGGGTYGDANLTKIFMGSAGAQGGKVFETNNSSSMGGTGGGIIIMYANHLTVTGGVSSNGNTGTTSTSIAGAGGGAGGSIYIASNTQSAAASLITVNGGVGGNGSSSVHGGNGGKGRIVNASVPAPTTTGVPTTTVTPTGDVGACTLINVYKKVDGVWGTTPLTTAELQQLKTGDILRFTLVSATDLSE